MFNVLTHSTIVSRVENEKGEGVYVAPRDENFYILVQRNGNNWEPVRRLESSVDRFSFQSEYAFLPTNGASTAKVRLSGLSYDKNSNSYLAGEELEFQADGSLLLHSKKIQFPSGHRPSREDHTEILEYHYDDSEWRVA